VIAGDQLGAALEDGVHSIAAEDEFATHLYGEKRGRQQAEQGVGDEHRQVGPASHRRPPSNTPSTASKALGTGTPAPGVTVGSVQGTTPGLQAPTSTLIRVA